MYFKFRPDQEPFQGQGKPSARGGRLIAFVIGNDFLPAAKLISSIFIRAYFLLLIGNDRTAACLLTMAGLNHLTTSSVPLNIFTMSLAAFNLLTTSSKVKLRSSGGHF